LPGLLRYPCLARRPIARIGARVCVGAHIFLQKSVFCVAESLHYEKEFLISSRIFSFNKAQVSSSVLNFVK
jgi:hypothetical protein